MNFVSHTLVRQGMPFIDLVLRQVIPFANRCLVTISEKSTDGTLQILRKLEKEFPDKIKIDFENVQSAGELTNERQKQVEKTYEDFILFLDDDDYWPTESLEKMIELIEKDNDVDGYSINPYQVIDQRHYDGGWWNKWFSKWFKNQSGINYRGKWPRDMIWLNDTMLYWKTNPCIPKVSQFFDYDYPRFFHLSYIKGHSFRSEDWAKKFAHQIGTPIVFPKNEMKHIWKIYEELHAKSSRT